MEELAPYVDDATSWRERRKLYEGILAKPDTFLLLARDDDSGQLIGYALTHIVPVEETWVADTWATGPRVADIESMGVLPGHRGAGIGTALLDAIDDELAARGIPDAIIGVLYGNNRALRALRAARVQADLDVPVAVREPLATGDPRSSASWRRRDRP